MQRRKLATVALAAAAITTLTSGIAAATWIKTGSGSGTSRAAILQPPATASAAPGGAAPTTSITITWTGPASGPAPTSYRVERVAPAATVCTPSASTLSCTDTGLTPGTAYSYNVFAVRSNWNGAAQATSTSTSASSDTTLPTVTAGCPVNGGSYDNAKDNGTGTYNKACGKRVVINATDNVAVTSAAVKLTKDGSCWTGDDSDTGAVFTVAQCTAAGPAGYPAGYVSLSPSTGSEWTRALSGPMFTSIGTWTLTGLARDAAGNTSSVLTVSFTIT